jgi:hypothetical protein
MCCTLVDVSNDSSGSIKRVFFKSPFIINFPRRTSRIEFNYINTTEVIRQTLWSIFVVYIESLHTLLVVTDAN